LIGKGKGGGVYLRNISLWIYILHPLAIVLVRAAAKPLDLTTWLVTNSLVQYTTVTGLSLGLSLMAVRILHDLGLDDIVYPSAVMHWRTSDRIPTVPASDDINGVKNLYGF
jgi:hypothetical protein